MRFKDQNYCMESIDRLVEKIRHIPEVFRTIGERPPDVGDETAPLIDMFGSEIPGSDAGSDFSEMAPSQIFPAIADAVREKGTDALAYYVSFHDIELYDSGRWGVYLLESGLVYLAAHFQSAHGPVREVLDMDTGGLCVDGKLPWNVAVEFARLALLHHELFHFETDCVAASWESLLQKPCWALHHDALKESTPSYDMLEEALANAHMFRSIRGKRRGASKWLRRLIENSPKGYRDALDYAGEQRFREGLGDLCLRYTSAPMTSAGLVPGLCALNFSRLFELEFCEAYLQCPVRLLADAESRGLPSLGLHFIANLPIIEETPKFKKRLSKCPQNIQKEWQSYLETLPSRVPPPTRFKKFQDCYSLSLTSVNGGYRAHLLPVQGFKKWQAIDIGDHLEMGHGK